MTVQTLTSFQTRARSILFLDRFQNMHHVAGIFKINRTVFSNTLCQHQEVVTLIERYIPETDYFYSCHKVGLVPYVLCCRIC